MNRRNKETVTLRERELPGGKGTDLYTLSKLMGHRSIKTTQVYAKILDKTKQAAVARIPEIF